jgi:hypothetical protein
LHIVRIPGLFSGWQQAETTSKGRLPMMLNADKVGTVSLLSASLTILVL